MDLLKEYVHKTKNALVVHDDKGFLVFTIHDNYIFVHDVYSRVFISFTGFIEMIRVKLKSLDFDYDEIIKLKGSVPKLSLCCDETLKVYQYYDFKIFEKDHEYLVEKEIEWAT